MNSIWFKFAFTINIKIICFFNPIISFLSIHSINSSANCSDFAYAKVYFSIFPFTKSGEVMEALEKNNWLLRRELGKRIRNQLKIVPELQFFLDDSLEYIENIDSLLKE